MMKLQAIVFTALCIYLPCSEMALADRLHLVTEERIPRQMDVDGNITGIAVEKVKDILRYANIDYDMHLYSFARASSMAVKDPDTCIFSIARTPEREGLFIWIEPPVMQINRSLFARADSDFKINSLADVRNLSIGTYSGDVLDEYFRKLNMNVDTAPADSNNYMKLIRKRIDLWATDELVGQYIIDHSGDDTKIVVAYAFAKQDIYLACSQKTSGSFIEKLQNAAQKVLSR